MNLRQNRAISKQIAKNISCHVGTMLQDAGSFGLLVATPVIDVHVRDMRRMRHDTLHHI